MLNLFRVFLHIYSSSISKLISLVVRKNRYNNKILNTQLLNDLSYSITFSFSLEGGEWDRIFHLISLWDKGLAVMWFRK